MKNKTVNLAILTRHKVPKGNYIRRAGRDGTSRGGGAREHARGEGCRRGFDEAGEGAQEGGRGPDGRVGTNVEDTLKVASPARFLGWTVEDGVLECVGGTLAAGACVGGVAVPGGVGPEVATPRSHLVDASRGELVKAHEGVRLKGGGVWVSGVVRSGLLPFFHEEVSALELELGVGAAQGGLGIVLGEQVLGGNWKGTEAVRAQEEQHGVWEGVEGEVGPVLRRRSCLESREGEGATRVPHAQDPVVRRVAVKRRGLQGGWEPCRRRVDFRGVPHDSKVRKAPFIGEEKPEGRKAGLDGQDVRWGRHEAIGSPSLDLVPEHGELPDHVGGRHEDVRSIAEDGEEEGGGEPMAEERWEANPRGGESLNRHEGRRGFGEPLDEMGGGGDRGGEPVTQPSDLLLGCKDRPIEVDRRNGDGVPVPGGAPMDEFRLGD